MTVSNETFDLEWFGPSSILQSTTLPLKLLTPYPHHEIPQDRHDLPQQARLQGDMPDERRSGRINHTEHSTDGAKCHHEESEDNSLRRESCDPRTTEYFTRLIDIYKELSRRRNNLILMQSRWVAEMDHYQHKFHFAQDSIMQVVATLSEQSLDGLRSTSTATFDTLKKQLATDGASLTAQSQTAMDLYTQMNEYHYKVAEDESEFLEVLSLFLGKLPHGKVLLEQMRRVKEDVEEAGEKLSDSSGDASIPELAHAYFEAVGLQRNLQEELMDLRVSYSEKQAQRSLIRDQDKEPSIPDSEFEQQYEGKFSELETRNEEAKRDAKQALKACQENDIDVNALQYRNDDDDTQTSPQQATEEKAHGSRPASPEFIFEALQKSLDADNAHPPESTLVGDPFMPGFSFERINAGDLAIGTVISFDECRPQMSNDAVEEWLENSPRPATPGLWARQAMKYSAETNLLEGTLPHRFIHAGHTTGQNELQRDVDLPSLRRARSLPAFGSADRM